MRYYSGLNSASESHLISLAVFRKAKCDKFCSRCSAHGLFKSDETNPTSSNTQCAFSQNPEFYILGSSVTLSVQEEVDAPLSSYVITYYCCNIYKQEKQMNFPLWDRRGEIYLHFFLPGEHLRQKSSLWKSFFFRKKSLIPNFHV